jgi:hypothetical protein
MRAPLDSPLMAEFRAQLDGINALADASPGFVWRIQTDEGDATAIRAFDDDRILFNMSVWESAEALHAYVYRSDHVGPMRKRREWFEPLSTPAFVLWWIPAGHVPTIAEALEKLRQLEAEGPSAGAFTFRQAFPPPGDVAGPALDVDAEFCAP